MGFSSGQVPLILGKTHRDSARRLMGSPLQERRVVGDFLNEASTGECET